MRARRQDRAGDRGVAGAQAKRGVHPRRQAAGDLDHAEVEQRPEVEAGRDLHGRRGGRRLQRVDQPLVIERPAVDRQCDHALVVAEAVQRGLETVAVVARAGHQGERADRRVGAQCDQRGGVVQRLVDRRIAGGGEFDIIGLRIGGVRGRTWHGQQQRQQAREGTARYAALARPSRQSRLLPSHRPNPPDFPRAGLPHGAAASDHGRGIDGEGGEGGDVVSSSGYPQTTSRGGDRYRHAGALPSSATPSADPALRSS